MVEAPIYPVSDAQAIDNYFEQEKPWEKSERDEKFRDYDNADPRVKAFYQFNHQHQTYDSVIQREKEYMAPESRTLVLPMWDALMTVGELYDESDPDVTEPQIVHAYQSAEAARKSKGSRAFVATALVHDVGKIIGTSILESDPKNPRKKLHQAFVVGDTFPVGCQFSDKIVYSHYFKDDPEGKWTGNPDVNDPRYNTPYGIYKGRVGFDNITFSSSHDVYLAKVLEGKALLDPIYLKMIKGHSAYPIHREGQYRHLLTAEDVPTLSAITVFNGVDLYSKHLEVDMKKMQQDFNDFYQPLIEELFPEPLNW